MPTDSDDRLEGALSAAEAAIKAARTILKQGLHAHEIPGGDLTDPAEDDEGHQHKLASGNLTGPPIETDEGHVHTLPGGGRTDPPFVPADDAAEKGKKKPAKKNGDDLLEMPLPVLTLKGPEALVDRMRAGEPVGYLSKRSKVAKIGEPHALIGDDKVWAIVMQCGPVPVDNIEGADEYIQKGAGTDAFVGAGYYLPVKPAVIFDPPFALTAPLAKRKTVTLSDDVDEEIAEVFETQEPADESAPEPETHEVEEVEIERPVKLLKRHTADNEDGTEHFVMGIVLVPDEPDAHGDTYDADTVRLAAHSFMENGGVRKIMHDGEPVEGITVLETRIAHQDEDHDGEVVQKGSWVLAVRITSQKLWSAVLDGTFTGFSMGGTAIREKLTEAPA